MFARNVTLQNVSILGRLDGGTEHWYDWLAQGWRSYRQNAIRVRRYRMLVKYWREGKVTEFEPELWEKLERMYCSGLPLAFWIRRAYFPNSGMPGQCLERRIYLATALRALGKTDVKVALGDLDELRMYYGSDRAYHGWVECDGYVYDSSTRLRYKRKCYYRVEHPRGVRYEAPEELGLYAKIQATRLEDYLPGGRLRHELAMILPLVQAVGEKLHDAEYDAELRAWMELTQYDEEEIWREMETKVRESLNA